MRLASETIDFIIEVLKGKNVFAAKKVSTRGERVNEGVKLRRRMLAGNDEAEVTVPRTPGVVDVRRMNAGFEKFVLEVRDVLRSLRMNGDDRAGPVVDQEARIAERGFDMTCVEGQAAAKFRLSPDELQSGQCSGSQRQGQRSVASEEPTSLDDFLTERRRSKNRPTVRPEGFAQSDGLDEPGTGIDAEMFCRAASRLAERSSTMGVVNEDGEVGRQLAEVFIKGRGFTTVGVETVSDEQKPRLGGAVADDFLRGARSGGCVAMGKGDDGAPENAGGVEERAVGAFINEGMGEFAGQRLRDGEIGDVTVGDKECAFRSKKSGDAAFKFAVERMVAGGFARGGDVEAKLVEAVMNRPEH